MARTNARNLKRSEYPSAEVFTTLFKRGLAYHQIAMITGVPESSVSAYCRELGLYRRAAKSVTAAGATAPNSVSSGSVTVPVKGLPSVFKTQSGEFVGLIAGRLEALTPVI